MSRKLINFGWQGPGHYLSWAQYLDPDYDPDCGIEVERLAIAYMVGGPQRHNLRTAAFAMLNLDDEKETDATMAAFNDTLEWLAARGWPATQESEMKFEGDAEEFLQDLRDRHQPEGYKPRGADPGKGENRFKDLLSGITHNAVRAGSGRSAT